MANGLINLQTDLKSLRYGNDKPYITKNIGDAPGSQIGLEVQTRIDDTSRIAQMLIDKPGIKYLLNEALLQQIGIDDKIRNRGERSVAGVVLGQLGNTLIGTTKILGSTLAQVPVNGTGLHFLKGFRTDTYLQNGTTRGFAQFFGAGGVEGAQYALQGTQVPANTLEDGTKIVQTTAAQKSIGISNKNIQGEITPLEPPVIKPFREEDQKKKAKNSTKDNITSALTGSAIPLSGPQSETTLTKESIGVSNETTGSITSGEIAIKPFEQSGYEDKKRSKLSTENNIANALTGSVIALSGTVETTATPGNTTKQNLIKGSLSNKDVTHDLGDNGNDGDPIYTADNPYTEQKTNTNIGYALTNNIIPTGKGDSKYIPTPTTTGATDKDLLSSVKESFLSGSAQVVPKTGPEIKIQDFRQGSETLYSFDYNNTQIKRETRVNLGDQGKLKPSGFYTSYSNVDPDAIDKLNALDISDSRIDGTQAARDLAKLYFEIITPDGSKFLHFRAFIDSIDDSYNADWQGSKYVGRAENFYTYGGFERDISISFKIAAATRSEMKPLYKKMVYLASSTAPTYGGQGFMRGSLARITVGSYLSQIPGVITSVKFNLIDGMPWEIAMQNPEAGTDDDVQELPMGLQCNISFKAIHDFAPQTGLQHYFTNPNPVNGSQPFF